MLIVGLFFFWVAVTSGLCGFADIFSAHAQALHLVFYSSLLVATLTFTMRLLRPADVSDAAHAEPAPAAVADSPRSEALVASSEPSLPVASSRGLVIAGPLVAGTR